MNIDFDANGTCTMLWIQNLTSMINLTGDWRNQDLINPAESFDSFVKCLNYCRVRVDEGRVNNGWTRYVGDDDIEDEHDDDDYDWDDSRPYRTHELGLICCITSSNQVKSEEFLKQFGFNHSEKVKSLKYQYSSDTTLWWMACSDFVKKLEEEMKRIDS